MVRWVLRISDGQKDLLQKFSLLKSLPNNGFIPGDGEIYILYKEKADMDEGWARLRRSGFVSTRMGRKEIKDGEKIWQTKDPWWKT